MMFDNTTILSTVIILLMAILSVLLRKLTVQAGIAGGLIALLLWEAFHFTGLLMLGSFFVLGSMATSWKSSKKIQLPSSHENESQRTVGQVLANGGIAGILAASALLISEQQLLFQLMMAGSFAAALSDTFSSEFGNVYGKRFYNICTFQKDKRGENGVVSLEGSLAGIAGAGIIAGLFVIVHQCDNCFLILLIAGISGNFVDSLLGAKFERRGLIGNNLVNLLNTAAGAFLAWLVMTIGN